MPISIDFEAIKSMLTHLGHLLLVAASVYRFLKLSIHVALTIVLVGVVISLLTHFGVIPPLNEIFAMLKP